MPRYITPKPPKPAELVKAEEEACAALREFFSRDLGLQAQMARDTGVSPAILSRMGKGRQCISIEHAMLIELASRGELRAEQLCPARADILGRFLLQRAASLGMSN